MISTASGAEKAGAVPPSAVRGVTVKRRGMRVKFAPDGRGSPYGS